MNLRFVALPSIDLDDGTFEIRKFTGSTRLRESLARFGILDPPWLRKKSAEYVVVDGFQKLRWAKEDGAQGTVCRIFPEDFDARELWMRRIEKKIFEREWGVDLAEKAQIMSVLVGLFQPGEVPGCFLSDLNVSNRPEVLRRWALLSAEGTETLELLASGAIAERAALEVADWDKKSRGRVLSVLQALRCSASIQVEIVERAGEIAIREGKEAADIIGSPRACEILSSVEMNRRQKTQALRDFLTELRHPRLSARRMRFDREMEALDMPSGARILPPVAFEGGNWKMELNFTGPEELRKILHSVGAAAASERLDTLFGPTASPGQR